jgi:hypothetical protein
MTFASNTPVCRQSILINLRLLSRAIPNSTIAPNNVELPHCNTIICGTKSKARRSALNTFRPSLRSFRVSSQCRSHCRGSSIASQQYEHTRRCRHSRPIRPCIPERAVSPIQVGTQFNYQSRLPSAVHFTLSTPFPSHENDAMLDHSPGAGDAPKRGDGGSSSGSDDKKDDDRRGLVDDL